MTESIRCPACRGTKKVPKLGSMIGTCNTCSGKGTILAIEKPKPVIVEPTDTNTDIINAVAQAVPISDDKFVIEVLGAKQPATKIDPKKAVYKRKKA